MYIFRSFNKIYIKNNKRTKKITILKYSLYFILYALLAAASGAGGICLPSFLAKALCCLSA